MTGFKIQTRARMMMWMIFSTRAFHAYASKKSSDKLRYVAIRGTVLYDGRCYGDRGMGGEGPRGRVRQYRQDTVCLFHLHV